MNSPSVMFKNVRFCRSTRRVVPPRVLFTLTDATSNACPVAPTATVVTMAAVSKMFVGIRRIGYHANRMESRPTRRDVLAGGLGLALVTAVEHANAQEDPAAVRPKPGDFLVR